ncbi:MAG: sensor histidine kinase [Actinobacteria bacterium]|nr:sensor histidine kinase [Actinomycetota bacterium]
MSHAHASDIAPEDLEWPQFLPIGSMAGAVFVAIESLWHRVAEYDAGVLAWDAPLVLLAAMPFVLDYVSHRHPERPELFLPRWLWAALTIGPVTAVLVHSPTSTDFAPFLVCLTCIQGGATARMPEGLAILVAACGAMIGIEATDQFDGALIWVTGYAASYAGGLAVQKSVEAMMSEHARHAESLAGAAAQERQRIAREIHDVIAHSLSVTMLHLTGARHALESGADATEAAEALRDAERLGRQAMTDIRRTVGLLTPDPAGGTAPMPGAADIPALVRGFADAGLDVACELHGDASAVPLATGLGLYRIAQESLANVAKHAPGSKAEVLLSVGDGDVRLVVRNDGRNGAAPDGDAGGLGLKGMEQRARLLGGTFQAGPEANGWAVEVSAPSQPAES